MSTTTSYEARAPKSHRGASSGRTTGFGSSERRAAVAFAAVCAVGFWSLKPVLITLVEDNAGYVEAYLLAAAASLLLSGVVVAVRWGEVRPVIWRGGLPAAGWAALSGVFLAGWYFGFYRALMTGLKVESTIIGFTWPLISVLAMRVFAPSVGERLTLRQWVLIVVAFAGAGVVTIGAGDGGGGAAEGLVWAGLAALGSGLYLPFAVKASVRYRQTGGVSLLWGTFWSISVANLAASATVLATAPALGYSFTWSAVGPSTIAVCALIGVGTYLVAEVAWTWAVQAHDSLALASLPYLSPAISVLLLSVIFATPVRGTSFLGLVVIVGANLLLHFGKRANNAWHLRSFGRRAARALR